MSFSHLQRAWFWSACPVGIPKRAMDKCSLLAAMVSGFCQPWRRLGAIPVIPPHAMLEDPCQNVKAINLEAASPVSTWISTQDAPLWCDLHQALVNPFLLNLVLIYSDWVHFTIFCKYLNRGRFQRSNIPEAPPGPRADQPPSFAATCNIYIYI